MIEIGSIIVKNHTLINLELMPEGFSVFEMFAFKVKDNAVTIVPESQSCPFCGRLGVFEFDNHFLCLECINHLGMFDLRKGKINGNRNRKKQKRKST